MIASIPAKAFFPSSKFMTFLDMLPKTKNYWKKVKEEMDD